MGELVLERTLRGWRVNLTYYHPSRNTHRWCSRGPEMGQNEGRLSDFWNSIGGRLADGAIWMQIRLILQEKGRMTLMVLQRPGMCHCHHQEGPEVPFLNPKGKVVAHGQGGGSPHPDEPRRHSIQPQWTHSLKF